MTLQRPRTRIAPTPSGYLHAGNGVAFALTAQLAKALGASIRLRIDDLDLERARPAYVDDIFSSLQWLGIPWEEGPHDRHDHERNWSQTARVERYQDALDLLKEQGDLFACACSRSGRSGCACRGRNIPFTATNAAWRLHIPSDAVVRMKSHFGMDQLLSPAELITQPVLRQRQELGGRPAYQIASLLEDVGHGITHIVRGVDLLPSSACQLYLAERLGLSAFREVRFVHHPLLRDADGNKLSKSDGAASLKEMRQRGDGPDGLLRNADMLLHELMRSAAEAH